MSRPRLRLPASLRKGLAREQTRRRHPEHLQDSRTQGEPVTRVAVIRDEEVADRVDGQRPGINEPGFRGQTAIPRKTVHPDPYHRGDSPVRTDLPHPVVPVIHDEDVAKGVYCQADGTI